MSIHTDLPAPIIELIEDMQFLDSWEDRYMHVIEMGKAMPPLAPAEMNEASKVRGCASQVWLVSDKTADEAGERFAFRGDSDAHIVKGLVAIVTALYSDRTADQILATDTPAVMAQLGLSEHLSAQRANGLNAMVSRIRAEAEASA